MSAPEREKTPAIDWEILLQHLQNLALRLEIEVRYESLADDEVSIHSGGCKARGRKLILIDKYRSLQEQAQVLARELSRYDLEDFYILPRVREFIAFQVLRREKNRPQT